jgi:tRNA-Thr(GGU) m(6)t(6)A37 methyltransferase TsaA
MTMNDMTYQVRPVGTVRVTEAGFTLHIEEPFRPALAQLAKFSHVKVIWWADQLDTASDRALLQVEPPYAPGETVGVFACCSPARPNPIAITTCFVLGVDEAQGVIEVPWIDALDGTPILDLKPYIPIADRFRDFYVPEWLAVLPAWAEEAASIPPGFFGE